MNYPISAAMKEHLAYLKKLDQQARPFLDKHGEDEIHAAIGKLIAGGQLTDHERGVVGIFACVGLAGTAYNALVSGAAQAHKN